MASTKLSLIIIAFTCFFVVLAVVSSIMGLYYPVMYLNEAQILYLFSTSAQVLAAIYGLTLTAFVFFRNELSREEGEDETLTDVIEALKLRYFINLMFVTVFVFVSLMLANLAISQEGFGSPSYTVVTINTAQSAYVVSLLVIVFFIVDVVSPRRIEATSKQQRGEVDPSYTITSKGSLEDFLRNYNQIEFILEEYGKPFQSGTSWFSARRRVVSNARIAEYMLKTEKITQSLYEKIRELIKLRNSIIHGAEPVVSQGLVSTSEEVLRELQAAIGDARNE